MRLMNAFREKVFWFATGISLSWARARSLLFASLTGGKRWWRTCLGFLRISPNICSSAESQICAKDGWRFGRNPPLTALFSTFSSLSRPWASSRPHHAWDAYVSLAMKVARVTSHSGGPLNPWCFKVPSAYIVWAPRTTNRSTCMVNEKVALENDPQNIHTFHTLYPKEGRGSCRFGSGAFDDHLLWFVHVQLKVVIGRPCRNMIELLAHKLWIDRWDDEIWIIGIFVQFIKCIQSPKITSIDYVCERSNFSGQHLSISYRFRDIWLHSFQGLTLTFDLWRSSRVKKFYTIRKAIYDFLSDFYRQHLYLVPFSRYSTSKCFRVWPWPLTSKKSSVIKKFCTIRKPIYDFLFDFYGHHLSISYRSRDNRLQRF